MQNITTHLSKSQIKPELCHVYVHTDTTTNQKHAVWHKGYTPDFTKLKII